MAEAETPPVGGDHGKGKKGGFEKHKVYYIGGGVLVLIVLFLAVRSSNNASNTAATDPTAGTNLAGINPATGYLYGSPADTAAQGGGSTTTGIPGPAGPAGPPGPAGPAAPVKTNPITKLPVTVINKAPGTTKQIRSAILPLKAKTTVVPVSNKYTVKPGDNLSTIAADLHIKGGWQALYNMNKAHIGKNPSLIHPGLSLRTK